MYFMNWQTHKQKLMKKPEFRQALKDNELEYLIAKSLVEVRTNKGFTQKNLADKMQTKQSVISRVESGKSLPSLSFLRKLASVLDLQLKVQFL